MDNVPSYLAPSCFMEFFPTARVDSLQDVVTGTDHRTLHGFLAAWKQQGTPLSPQLRATISVRLLDKHVPWHGRLSQHP